MGQVRKIEKLEGTGAFTGLAWDADPARTFNLIYGWNASGKTTVSRIFRFIETGEIYLPGFEAVSFRLRTDSGTVTEADIGEDELSCRVFNEDFIEANLHFRESSADPIIIIGKEDVELGDEIEEAEANLADEKEEVEKLQGRVEEIPDLGSILTDCGSAVVEEFAGTPLASSRYHGRSYNRRKVRARLENDTVTQENVEEFIVGDESELATLREQVRREQSEVSLPSTDIGDVEELFIEGNRLLELSVASETIERLEEDDKLRQWVQAGHEMHREREESTCQFCGNELPGKVMERYSRYFTEEVVAADKQLGQVVRGLEEVAGELDVELPDSEQLFSDLRAAYRSSRKQYSESRERLNESCQRLIGRLRKREGRFQIEESRQEGVDYPDSARESIDDSMSQIREIFNEHNQRVSGVEEKAEVAAEKLELHQVASTLSDQRYFHYKNRKSDLKSKLEEHDQAIEDYQQAIRAKEAKLRNTALAVEEINSVLATFLGEGEIELQLDEGEDTDLPGYQLISRGEPVRYLSDGERSVVALAYFLVSLKDEECELENTIVVLDDPVDSQDAVFLYRTFGLLKRRLYNAGQVVLLTHNYQLFNTVRDWLTSESFYEKSRLLHIRLERGDEKRVIVDSLPELLRDFKSEYQYLVYRLNCFRSNPSPGEAPVIPNIARKVLENFASFKWSCRTSQALNDIVQSQFIKGGGPHLTEVGEAVVKFLHEYSHGHDFGRPVTASVMEAEAIAANVLDFIYWSDEEHFQTLIRRIEASEDS